MRWECSSVRESNRLKTDVSGEDLKNSLNSKDVGTSESLPIPIPFFNTKNVFFSQNDINRNIKIPNKLTTYLAEDIGIQIGDGGVYIYKDFDGDSHYRIECYGHIIEDENYLNNFIIPLKEKLFNLSLKLKYHKLAGTCYLRIGSKALVTFYHNVIGLPIGKKSEIFIPEIILNSSDEIMAACLRGLGDTDFSLSFQKKQKEIHYYPILHITSCSKILIEQTSFALDKLGISNNTNFDYHDKDKRTGKTYIKHDLFVCGKRNLKLWMKLIGFHNINHFSRYQIWKKFGFCPPKTTLEQRIKILNGDIDPKSLECQ